MKSRKAFVLVLSVITTLIVSAFVESFLVSLNSHINLIAGQRDDIRAYNMAEAGLARGIIELRGVVTATDFSGSLGAGTYSVHFTLLPFLPGQLPSFGITSTGGWGNASRTLNLEVFQKSFSQWVSFTNSENDINGVRLYFITGDIADGPVHTNGQFNMHGTPRFLGHVSSVAPTIYGSQAGVFSGGLTLGAAAIPIQSPSAVLAPISAAAAAPGEGLFLNGDTTIEFTEDGNMWVTNAEVSEGTRTLNPLPANGAIYVDGGDLKISGTLNGRVSVGAGEVDAKGGDITILGDLKYAGPRDAAGLPTSPDSMMGLVAEKNVYIGTMAQADVEINAYIVTPSKSFMFPEYATAHKGILKVYGGMMQMYAGVTGVFNETGVISGYAKQIITYDKRMKSESPPFFNALVDATGRTVYAKRLWKGR